MSHPILFDLAPLSCGCTDHVLDSMYKALSDPPDSDLLWKPHHSPYLRKTVETVTLAGQRVLNNIQHGLLKRLAGDVESSGDVLLKANSWDRWNQKKFNVVKKLLENKSLDGYTIDDWMLLVDWLIQKYLPTDVIQKESEYLAVRSSLAGKLQVNIDKTDKKKYKNSLIENLVLSLPHKINEISFTLNARENAVITFAHARATELISGLGDRTRHRIKQIILEYEYLNIAHDPLSTVQHLQNHLLDEFGALNRDWRRIALTETVRNANEGFIAGLAEGTRVRRIEVYEGACDFCRKINGMEFTVVSASKKNKNGETEVWVGKTNQYRASSPRKRQGGELVERSPAEMWWPAAGAQHPNCRGSWVTVDSDSEGVSDDFVQWLENELEKERQAHT